MKISKPGQHPFEVKRKRMKKERISRAERFHRHVEKLHTYRALKETYEQLGNFDEVRRLAVRIRTEEQCIRYMGLTDEEIQNDDW